MRVLITGATSGIGEQLAIDYHNDGHEVWALGRNSDALAKLAYLGLHTTQVDLSNREEALQWFATLPSLDLAILSAGTCEYIDLPHFDSALVCRVMRGNVESMAVSIEGVLPALRRGEQPHLVGLGSSVTYLPLPRSEAYGASKAAIAYLLDTLRIDLYDQNIAVSHVCPGFVKTPLTDKNDFPMPLRISTTKASAAIRRGISNRKAEIHFPKRFTYILKLLSLLPNQMWTKLAQGLRKT